jgi:hypothetical protein
MFNWLPSSVVSEGRDLSGFAERGIQRVGGGTLDVRGDMTVAVQGHRNMGTTELFPHDPGMQRIGCLPLAAASAGSVSRDSRAAPPMVGRVRHRSNGTQPDGQGRITGKPCDCWENTIPFSAIVQL